MIISLQEKRQATLQQCREMNALRTSRRNKKRANHSQSSVVWLFSALLSGHKTADFPYENS